MARTDTGDRVCLNHPNRPATARCNHCQKPVCAECTVARDTTLFCSEACAKARDHFQSRESQRALEGKKRERFSVGEWAVRGVLVLLAAVILYYVFVVQDVRSIGDFAGMLRRMF